MKKFRLFLSAAVLAALPLGAAPRSAAEDPETAGMDFKKVDKDRLIGILPPEVKTVAVLTPASKPGKKTVLLAAEMLKRAGIKVKIMPHALDDVEPGQKYLPLKGRLEDWNQAVGDPEVDMIICTRGGTGAQDLIKVIDWEKFKARNLTLLGFSNVTMLTGAMVKCQAGRPVAGPNLTSMVGATDDTLAWLKKMLAREPMPPVKLKPMANPGDAKGPVYAGHLKMLQMVDEGDFHVDTAGRVVFIECVRREAPEVREYLEALRKRGFFDKPAAVVFCYFNRVRDEKAIWKMLGEFAATLKCPVYRGFPYGHKSRNYALDYTRTAVIRDGVLTFE